jgi:hypothetical protein
MGARNTGIWAGNKAGIPVLFPARLLFSWEDRLVCPAALARVEAAALALPAVSAARVPVSDCAPSLVVSSSLESSLEPALRVPSDASKDCQLARKLSAPGAEVDVD